MKSKLKKVRKMIKRIIVVGAMFALAGCSSIPEMNQALDDAKVDLNAHVVKGQLNQNFCEGRGFYFYSETAYSYQFRCRPFRDEQGIMHRGGYYALPKSEG